MVKYGTAATQPQLPLYRAGETADDVPFGEDEEAERRNHRRRRVREDARGVLRVLRLERGDAERQREVARVAQYEQRQQVRIPTRDEREHRDRSQRRTAER